MILNNRKYVKYILILLLLMPNFAFSDSKYEGWREEFSMRIRQFAKGEIGADVSNLDDGILEQQASIIASDSTIPAIFELWLRDKPHIDFFWWKQESRATRCFVMALYPEAVYVPEDRPFPLSAGPNFSYNISRFNKSEVLQRNEEKIFVREHLTAISKIITKIFEIKEIDKSNPKSRQFKFFIENNIGKSLP